MATEIGSPFGSTVPSSVTSLPNWGTVHKIIDVHSLSASAYLLRNNRSFQNASTRIKDLAAFSPSNSIGVNIHFRFMRMNYSDLAFGLAPRTSHSQRLPHERPPKSHSLPCRPQLVYIFACTPCSFPPKLCCLALDEEPGSFCWDRKEEAEEGDADGGLELESESDRGRLFGIARDGRLEPCWECEKHRGMCAMLRYCKEESAKVGVIV